MNNTNNTENPDKSRNNTPFRGAGGLSILVFDNYDSFTYNLVHAIKKLGYDDVEVHRNDQIALEEIERFDKIILSPGPGLPHESGILLDVIRTYYPTKSILGVCLGHQAIAEAFGGKLINLPEVFHGVSTRIHVIDNEILFYDMLSTLEVGRYQTSLYYGCFMDDGRRCKG